MVRFVVVWRCPLGQTQNIMWAPFTNHQGEGFSGYGGKVEMGSNTWLKDVVGASSINKGNDDYTENIAKNFGGRSSGGEEENDE